MPILSRKNCGKLLKQVQGRPHASSDDHQPDTIDLASDTDTFDMKTSTMRRSARNIVAEKSWPTPPATSSSLSSQNAAAHETIDLTDVNADPESDDSLFGDSFGASGRKSGERTGNVDSPESVDLTAPKKNAARRAGFKKTRGIDDVSLIALGTNSATRARFKAVGGLDSIDGNKRQSMSDDGEAEPDFMREHAQQLRKKRKIEKTPQTSGNIHAPQATSKKSFPRFGKVEAAYGKAAKRKKDAAKRFETRNGTVKGPKRKSADFKALDISEVGLREVGPKFKMSTLDLGIEPGDTPPPDDDAASIHEAENRPDSEDDQPDLDSPTIECTFCGQHVDRLLKEDFDDNINKGNERSFKWQRRFCEYHKKNEASDLWQARGYPDIEWLGLERRMKRHDNFLTKVLRNVEPSFHRNALEEKLKPRMGGFQQVIGDVNGGKPGASVGYYGPRGEKMMIEHVVNSMSKTFRQQAAKDKTVAASGVQGGVSGFVQSVLVPHLAELLIRDDMNLKGLDWTSQARTIIAESAEVGELLHPDTEDAIVPSTGDADDGEDD